jgi:Transposase DDE domain
MTLRRAPGSKLAQLKKLFPVRMKIFANTSSGRNSFMKKTRVASFQDILSHFLTPQVYKQAHQVWQPGYGPPRWSLQTLVWTLLAMAFCAGDSQEERFATARAAYVAAHQKLRRPGTTLIGFGMALIKLPLVVFRALALGVRQQIHKEFVAPLRINGWLPMACDGTRLECPRSEQLQCRLGQAGKPLSAPMVYLTTLVLLPLGLPWAWRWGKGTASEHDHLRHLLPTLPERSVLVCDAFYAGYQLFRDILRARASFLIRMSSRLYLYTLKEKPLPRFREGLVYYWPKHERDKGQPPLRLRLVRVRGKKADVWLLTNVLDRQQLSRKAVGQIYRWRWKNEGLFRIYKRMLGKVKLRCRTVAMVHREAEGSLLAMQLLLAMAAKAGPQGQQTELVLDSPRRVLLGLRGDIAALLRSLGPRQFAEYQDRLEEVRSQEWHRTRPKVRQHWPFKRAYKPPKPPKLLVMPAALKVKMDRTLRAA